MYPESFSTIVSHVLIGNTFATVIQFSLSLDTFASTLSVMQEPKIRLCEFLQQEAVDNGLCFSTSSKHPSCADGPLSSIKDLTYVIYASNKIEQAGSSRDRTLAVCKALKTNTLDPFDSSISDGDVIRHYHAFLYMLDKFVVEEEPMSDELITRTHRILCSDNIAIAGRYRKMPEERVAARNRAGKSHEFLRPQFVGTEMRSLVTDLKEEIERSGSQEWIDPYELAARYKHRFVNIHPFMDGNGRMCRILMNALLLRSAGHFCAFGLDDAKLMQYFDVVVRGSRKSREEEFEIEEGGKVEHHEFAKILLKKSKPYLADMGQG